MSKFQTSQEATTKVYQLILQGGATPDGLKFAISRMGCGGFTVPPRCGFGAVASATVSSPRLADAAKPLATRVGGIFEMGSSPIWVL